ncbi:MAG: type ISP restriction/modification enzyme, partial [Candidatus Paceibacterota bacterium]
EHHPDTGTLFASWLSQEANEANHVKRDTPVMVVMGNPPYSVSSSNKSDWIEELMEDYKKDLNERNIQPLSDDYLKFIRFGEYYIDKNGEGVLAYISNNSFIDGLIHRKVREHLLETFDDIYILDLHGSTKRKETAPDGSKDENVFDILSGVSINLFVKKTSNKKQKAKLKKFDLFGERKSKYEFLSQQDLSVIKWKEVQEFDEQFSFKPYSPSDLTQSNSFELDNLFKNSASGITTERDNLTIQFSEQIFERIKDDLFDLEEKELRQKYKIGKDGRDWKLETAKEDLRNNTSRLIEVLYRPLDIRHTLYTGNSKGFHSYPRSKIMDNLVGLDNLALIVGRQGQAMGDGEWNIVSISNKAVDCNIYYRGRGTVFPIYLYP